MLHIPFNIIVVFERVGNQVTEFIHQAGFIPVRPEIGVKTAFIIQEIKLISCT